jgi:hypothetical protein
MVDAGLARGMAPGVEAAVRTAVRAQADDHLEDALEAARVAAAERRLAVVARAHEPRAPGIVVLRARLGEQRREYRLSRRRCHLKPE